MSSRPPPFDAPAREREWLAQESALERERRGLGPDEHDVLAARYGRIAHGLRTVPQPSLPADFATRVASLAEASHARVARTDAVDRTILIALCAGFVLAMAVATRVLAFEFGGALANAVLHRGQWGFALFLCLSISLALNATAPSRRAGK